jgi:SAM-dependent methyltransferase
MEKGPPMAVSPWSDPHQEAYRQVRISHWNGVAREMEMRPGWGGAYHQRLTEVYGFWIPPGQRVLEVGCGYGDLLAALKPARGVGVDFSPEMIRYARERHPELHFVEADAHSLELDETFDAIILSDVVNDLWDVQAVLDRILPLCTWRTRIMMNSYSRLWELPLTLVRKLGLARPVLNQNWLTSDDLAHLLCLSEFEVVRHWQEILLPLKLPWLHVLCNRFLAKIFPFRLGALSNFVLARPLVPNQLPEMPLVSVVVPARNEEGSIPEIFTRTPEMGRGTELIFVEGHSKDDTCGAIEREMVRHPKRRCRLLRQTGVGKGDAVRLGFSEASGDLLMILDADLTVPPEDLPRFYEAIVSGKAEFINGVRLVYPMEKQAMRYANLVGNKFFSLAFSWLLGQPIKDTLCGTKVLWKRDYEQISANRTHFGDFDPFGDYDLIFGAAKLGLKMMDLPIRYRERSYGRTNIQRWKHGWSLLKMVLFAAWRIKFV